MYVQEHAFLRTLCRSLCIGAVSLSGCGLDLGLPRSDGLPTTLNLATINAGGTAAFVESARNNVFGNAESIELSPEALLIEGRIESGADVDIFDLGPVSIGDRVIVSMSTAESLNGAIGLFDATGAALLINDHRNVYLGRTEPYVDVIIRHASEACYVAVSATPGYESVGDYALAASKEIALDPPPPRPDTVLLVFDGGIGVRIGTRPTVDLPPFDAGNISSTFADSTSLIADEITARVREDYAAYDVLVLSTTDGDRYEAGMSRIFFGSYDPELLGVAEGIDEFNATRSQQAIVFTDTFRALTRLRPSVDELSQAIANVASHEIGHLLGMVHTADPRGLMDVTASLAALMRDQVFSRSPIYADAFPVGDQDAIRYLLDTVGGDESLAYAHRTEALRLSRIVHDDGDPTPARLRLRLSTCCLHKH